MSPECLNGHHVTERWAAVAWRDGEAGYCPQCDDVRKIGSAGTSHDRDGEKSDVVPSGQQWYGDLHAGK